MHGAWCWFSLAALMFAAGCGEPNEPTRKANSLPRGVVARVGSELIQAETVERIARAERVIARVALQRAVDDAVFAAHAKADEARRPLVGSAERSVLARALLEKLAAEARARGPVTRREVERETAVQWLKYDRPSAVQTTHAVARVTSPDQRDQAREVAEKIAAAVAGVTDKDEFIKRARAVDAGRIKVVAESLPPVAADGRVVPQQAAGAWNQPERFDEAFARAANAISEVGGQSGVVRSSYGFHVILLEKKLPEHHVPFGERARLLESDIMAERAKRARDELLGKLREIKPLGATDKARSLLGLIRLAL